MKGYLYYICWLLLFSSSVLAQEGLTATLDSNQLLIGARMHISLQLDESQKFKPLATSIPGVDSIQPVEIINNPEWVFNEGRWKSDMEITVFDTGYFLLPPVSLSGDLNGESLTYNSKRLGIYVYAMPVDSSGVMPIKPIVEEPLSWKDYKFIFIGIGVIILIVLLIWLFKKINNSTSESIPFIPPREAHITALEKLDKLEMKELWQKGLVKEYYVELGDILREYFENRFKFPALEMTSLELERAMDSIDDLKEYGEKAHEFFSMTDLVKFAKALPEDKIHSDWLSWVRQVIISTRSVEEDISENKKEEGV